MRKYYLAALNVYFGEYQVDTSIRFSTEDNPEFTLHDIAREFWGQCHEDDDGRYYFNGGEIAVEVGYFEEVSKEVYDAIPIYIAPVLWRKETVNE